MKSALVLLLLASPAAARRPADDSLSRLEQSDSPEASRQLSALYSQTKSPYERIWIVDALFSRVQRHRDAQALEALARATEDKNDDVRRRAVSGLIAFKALPDAQIRRDWLSRVQSIAGRAEKDPSKPMQAAGQELRRGVMEWEQGHRAEPAVGGRARAAQAPAPDEPRFHLSLGVFIWVIAFQLTAYLWQKMTLRLLKDSGEAGQAAAKVWSQIAGKSWLFTVVIGCSAAAVLAIGFLLARVLIVASLPPGTVSVTHPLALAFGLYWAFGLAALLPAAALANAMAGKWPFRRLPSLVVLATVTLYFFMPLEAIARLRGKRGWWPLRAGSLLAATWCAVIMARENVGWKTGLKRAAQRFGDEAFKRELDWLGRAVLQPGFVAAVLSAPVLLGASLLPAMIGWGFKPAQLLGLWFVSDKTFAVGFGLWAGALFSTGSLALALAGAAAHGGKLYERGA